LLWGDSEGDEKISVPGFFKSSSGNPTSLTGLMKSADVDPDDPNYNLRGSASSYNSNLFFIPNFLESFH
jgi:hypothetical protein